jgi:hypothetical protein
MRNNPCLEIVLTELRAAGVRDYRVLRRRRRHLQVRWSANSTTRAVDRVVTVSATPSTPRAAWAARGDVRRLLRIDGIIQRQGGLPKFAGGASSSVRPSGSRRTAKTDGNERASIRDVYHGERQ